MRCSVSDASTMAMIDTTASRGTVRAPRTFFAVAGCGLRRSGMIAAITSSAATTFVVSSSSATGPGTVTPSASVIAAFVGTSFVSSSMRVVPLLEPA
jgi:hypothetical protein